MADRWQWDCGSWSAGVAGMTWRCYLVTCRNLAWRQTVSVPAEHSTVVLIQQQVYLHTSDALYSSLLAAVGKHININQLKQYLIK